MLKKLTSLLLVLALGLTLWITPAAAFEREDLRSYAASVYDAFAASVYQSKADEKAIDQLLEASLYDGGKTLYFDGSDAVTACIYESVVFRNYFISALSFSIPYIQQHGLESFLAGGNANWYDFGSFYSVTTYTDLDYRATDKDTYYLTRYNHMEVQEPINRCDSALSLIVGAMSTRILFTRTAVTEDSVTYDLTIYLMDSFDFSNNYNAMANAGYDTSLSKLITSLGPLIGLKSFDWRSQTHMTITVPNTCSHSGEGVYRWENSGQALESVSGEGYLENRLLKQTKSVKNSAGVSSNISFYQLEAPIYLFHDAPWSIEVRFTSKPNLGLSATQNIAHSPYPSFAFAQNRVAATEVKRYWDTDPAAGSKRGYSDQHSYGLHVSGSPQTYRIENRIDSDGTNRLWLSVDGVELGELKEHTLYKEYDRSTLTFTDEPEWVSGKDFVIRYVHNLNYGFTTNSNIQYLQIDTGEKSHCQEISVQPSCTSAGGQASRCILCGLVTVHTPGEPLPHNPEVWAGYAPTCDKEGLTDGSKCADCGTILQERQAISSLPHTPVTVPGFAPTCKDKGLSDGSKCAVCNKVLVYQQTIENTGHTFESMPSKPATCTEEGSSGGSWCPTCEKILMPANALPALGHNFKNGKCKNCGEADPDVPVLMGDTDGDGAVTYMDAMQALQIAVGLLESDPVCDMDADNTVTYLDAMQILRLAVGLA